MYPSIQDIHDDQEKDLIKDKLKAVLDDFNYEYPKFKKVFNIQQARLISNWIDKAID